MARAVPMEGDSCPAMEGNFTVEQGSIVTPGEAFKELGTIDILQVRYLHPLVPRLTACSSVRSGCCGCAARSLAAGLSGLSGLSVCLSVCLSC